ncbi:electron transporter RnfC [Candidatus Epulonipiscium fishelsonii]|uniref:Electron transporter RnfC n=1 Tax=Candidatus Epulonipiscium fishelsonii TaxID=77094 RepID=A0ACC8XFK0_9FIRM|nr:electron transporter RnfC [Epulopiscium sp. SCG-B11WGA-EpuloA1]ONI43860.1 electron transporter RnfC [Epulopiscium sp. SCG-B05WGA-EpuloA1]
MSFFTFKGDIRPSDAKEMTKHKAIVELKPQKELVYPLSQHFGEPAKPIVKVKDEVKRGQMIAKANEFVSAPIFSSVSGVVTKIEPRFTPTGEKVDSIIIENDEKYEEVEFIKVKSIDTLSKKDIIGKVQQAGIVGLGGVGFPTHVKLSPTEPNKIEYVIANCAESEPYLTGDYRRMLENPEELISGMNIILKLFDNASGIFGIEDNKPDCIEKLNALIKDEPRMKVVAVKTKYPQGAESQLIYAITKRALKYPLAPKDVGCIVNNVETMVAIHNAVINGVPLMERVVTVSGDGINEPGNFKIPIGTNHNELIEAAGGLKENVEKIISGGPMMGFAMFTTDVPITKTSAAFLAFTYDEVAAVTPSACINCGRCVSACPSRIIPSRVAKFAELKDSTQFEKYSGMDCVGCGNCSFACPAKKHLKQAISAMKKLL